jgi:hypothetical protein
MTILATPLSLGSVQALYGGSTPTSASEYYRAGTSVANTVLGNAQVVTSGDLKFGNYVNADTTTSNLATAEYIANNIQYFAYGPPTVNAILAFPGYNRAVNSPYSVNTASTAAFAQFSNSTLVTSETTSTVVVFAVAQNPNITSVLINGATYTAAIEPAQYAPANVTISMAIYQLPTPVSQVSSVRMAWTRSNANNGSWPVILALPGTWDLFAAATSVEVGDTLPSGDMHIILRGGGDSSSYVPALGVPSVLNWTEWWYNAFGMQLNINYTSSTQTYDTAVAYTAIKLRKR